MTSLITPGYFELFLGLAFIFSLVKQRQSAHFFTRDAILKKFSIMELEMPATAQELVNIIKGLYLLPAAYSKKAINALRGQLFVGFLSMPFAYGVIFMLCMRAAGKMTTHIGSTVFTVLAWVQLFAWLFDIGENIYLLQKIRPQPALSTKNFHRAYLVIEFLKWGFSLIALVCGISAFCYLFLAGEYDSRALHHVLIIFAELIGYFVLNHFTKPTIAFPTE